MYGEELEFLWSQWYDPESYTLTPAHTFSSPGAAAHGGKLDTADDGGFQIIQYSDHEYNYIPLSAEIPLGASLVSTWRLRGGAVWMQVPEPADPAGLGM